MTAAEIDARIELYVRNDAVKAFHNLQLNAILHALNQNISDSVSGIMRWGNIQGDINDQDDLITLIEANIVKVRNTTADLTNVGIEIVVNNGIYNYGVPILILTSPVVVYLRETDFTLISGKWTCNSSLVTGIPGGIYQISVSEYNRFIFNDGNIVDANDGAHPEWQTVTGGGFQINMTEFDPSVNTYHIYVYPSIS